LIVPEMLAAVSWARAVCPVRRRKPRIRVHEWKKLFIMHLMQLSPAMGD
jgi:hypothetical protein